MDGRFGECKLHPLIVIAGPTGSGKSELALAIAAQFEGEIVNCDSVQVYRGFDIGAAKLGPTERKGIVHHLIDVVKPGELFTAGDYGRRGRQAVREIAARGRLPIVAGGTGFYLNALLDGLPASPARDEALRRRLLERQNKRPGSLHRILRRLAAPAAARIHPNDLHKSMRALEMRLLGGSGTAEPLTGFAILKIGLNPDRALLYAHLDTRLEAMFESGLLAEVQTLLAQGVSPSAKPFASLGYNEALQLLDGSVTREAALAMAQQHTRNYAKRQLTWFRRDTDMHWIDGFGSDPPVQEKAVQLVSEATRS